MTKRQLERELSQLSDQVLDDLDPDTRLQTYLNKSADGKSDQAERLDETAPRDDYSVRDPDYITKRLAAELLVREMVYTLHRLLLTYRWHCVSEVVLALTNDGDDPDDGGPQPGIVLWELLEMRGVYAEFVDEEFDMALAEFLSRYADGRAVLAAVDETVLEERALLENSVRAFAERQVTEADAPSSAADRSAEDIHD